ncbi:hypothetical protein LCGC14_1808280, partial [marine sediment metagenome]
HINLGETYALVGESGAGKSTVAHSILKLLPNNASYFGDINFYINPNNESFPILKAPEEQIRNYIRGNAVSIIFQEPMTSLNPLHIIKKQIAEIINLHQNFNSRETNNIIIELFEQVQLENPESFMIKYPHQLSGGQRQRIMIAMALANKPDLLIADEPTTALDVTIQMEILKLLNKLQKDLGMSLLLITHDLSIVERMADRIGIMKNGIIVEQGDTKRIFNCPEDSYTEYLLSSKPKQTPKPIKDTNKTILKTDNLKVFYPIYKGVFRKVVDYVKAVNGLTIKIQEGETVGLVGESGSGKTTFGLALLRLISSDGSIEFDGIELQGLKSKELQPFRKDIQIVFQDPFASLNPRMTIGQIINEGLEAHNYPKGFSRQERISQSLLDVGLEPDFTDRYPHEFSGGQRQRISIARALILKPKLIILDEPTSALDRSIQNDLIDLLLKLQEQYKFAYLFISHDLSVIRAMSHRIIVIKDGIIVEQGTTKEIFANPKEEYTKKLFNAVYGELK